MIRRLLPPGELSTSPETGGDFQEARHPYEPSQIWTMQKSCRIPLSSDRNGNRGIGRVNLIQDHNHSNLSHAKDHLVEPVPKSSLVKQT